MSVLHKQVGGNHYEKMKFQPIQLFSLVGFAQANFASCIVKYLRHKDKNGIQDLQKGLHYCEMLSDDLGCPQLYEEIKKYETSFDLEKECEKYLTYLPDDIMVHLAPSNKAMFCYYAKCNELDAIEASIVAYTVTAAFLIPMHPCDKSHMVGLEELLKFNIEDKYPEGS